MTDTADSAVAPAARCRKVRRGSFISIPPSLVCLFDHLVGKQLHRVGHLDAERPGRLQVDDKLEFGRLRHWQIGWLLPFENPPNIDAYKAIHFCQAVAICHQTASTSEVA